MDAPTQLATFGSGCFWCSEAVFVDLKGVLKVISGYAGGTKPNLAKVTLARKIAAIVLAIWKTEEEYAPDKHRKPLKT